MNRLRRHHPFALMLLFLAFLITLQVVLHVWPLLLIGGAVWLGWRSRHRALSHVSTTAPPPLVQGHVDYERAELARLRDDNAKLRAKVRVLSDMINGPEARP